MKVGEVRFTYCGLQNNLFTWNTVTWLKLSYDFMSWWHFGFKQHRVRVLPMVGEISTLPALLPTQFHHLLLNEEDHIHSFPQIHTKRITFIRVVLAWPYRPRKRWSIGFAHVSLLDFDFQIADMSVMSFWVQLHVFHFTVDRRRRMAYRIFIFYIYIYNSIWLVVHCFLLSVLHVYVGATVAGVVVLCGRCGCLCPC